MDTFAPKLEILPPAQRELLMATKLKVMVYFQGGDLARLSKEDRATLTCAAREVKSLPQVSVESGLGPG